LKVSIIQKDGIIRGSFININIIPYSMWIMKLSLDAKNLFFGRLALKHKIALFGSPLSFSHANHELLIQISGVIVGSEQNKKKFIDYFKKSSRVTAFESNKDYIVASYKTSWFTKWLDNKHLIHSAHLSIDFDGTELLTIESFQKLSLIFLFEIFKIKYKAKLISLQKEKSSVIPVLRSSIDLTSEQRFALELALNKGYYKIPRKISVKELSKIARLSYSTFQQHLRKAESKILPSL